MKNKIALLAFLVIPVLLFIGAGAMTGLMIDANNVCDQQVYFTNVTSRFYGDISEATGGGASALPDQSGHSGEYLATDGNNASWAAVATSALAVQNYTADFFLNEALNGYTISNYGATGDVTGTMQGGLSAGWNCVLVNQVTPDSVTKVLLHLDNNILDTANTPNTVTNTGVTFSNTPGEFKFGYAGVFDGSSKLSIPHQSFMDIGTADFTVDCWVYIDAASNTGFLGIKQAANRYLEIWKHTTNLRFIYQEEGGTTFDCVVPYPAADAWHHFAWTRTSGTMYIFIDGVPQSITYNTGNGATSLPTINGIFTIGYTEIETTYLTGKIDEFRWSSVGRWTADFSASLPAAPYTVKTGNITLTPPAGGQLPGTTAANYKLKSSAKNDLIKVRVANSQYIIDNVFPASTNWADTAP